jgi:Domain of unknown function (DUF3391)/HD domain
MDRTYADSDVVAVMDDPPSIASQKHHKIAASRLRAGMFVAELDRPWLDTPFLLQGFLIDSASELETLQRYCRFVYVDLDLSNPETIGTIRHAEQRTARESSNLTASDRRRQARLRTRLDRRRDVASASADTTGASLTALRRTPWVELATRERFRDLVRASSGTTVALKDEGLLKRVLGKIRPRFSRAGVASDASERQMPAALREQLLAWLPAGMELTAYEERMPAPQDVPRAQQALSSGKLALSAVIDDVRHGACARLEPLVRAVDGMVDVAIASADALLWVARPTSPTRRAEDQGVAVAIYMIALGRHLGLPRQLLSQLGQIGMLADIGKAKLPAALLDKPGMLSAAEHSIIKEHVRLGLDAVKSGTVRLALNVEEGIAQHHERLDGCGYPKGLKGTEIGPWGRMAAIADCFAALVTSRPYATALPAHDALMSIYQWAGTSFDAALVEQFVQAIGAFPVGSLVELTTGQIAVVSGQRKTCPMQPRVQVLTSPDRQALSVPLEQDLSNARRLDRSAVRIARGLPADTSVFIQLEDPPPTYSAGNSPRGVSSH